MVSVLLAVLLPLFDFLFASITIVLQQDVLRKVVAFLVERVVTTPLFVQLEDVSAEEIVPYVDFKHLLEDSPVVKWGDPGFWNKLRYFLPEPVYLTFHRYNYTAYI